MRNDLEEKKIHGSPLFRFQYYPKPEGCTQLLVPCHWHEEVEILVVEKGRLTVIIDGKHLTSSEGEVFFVNSGQLHQMQGYPLMNIMAELKRLVEERPIAYELLVKAELYRLIALLRQHQAFVLKETQTQEHSYTALRLKTVLQYVADHYMESISLEQAADLMHMSPKYFSSYFSDTLHISFIQYLNRYRVEQACILLQTTALSVMEIGLASGYSNFSYFIRRFKEFQGCTPLDYRKQLNTLS